MGRSLPVRSLRFVEGRGARSIEGGAVFLGKRVNDDSREDRKEHDEPDLREGLQAGGTHDFA
jgi:hypothetical protein